MYAWIMMIMMMRSCIDAGALTAASVRSEAYALLHTVATGLKYEYVDVYESARYMQVL